MLLNHQLTFLKNKFRNELHSRGGSFRDTVLCFGDAEDESYALW